MWLCFWLGESEKLQRTKFNGLTFENCSWPSYVKRTINFLSRYGAISACVPPVADTGRASTIDWISLKLNLAKWRVKARLMSTTRPNNNRLSKLDAFSVCKLQSLQTAKYYVMNLISRAPSSVANRTRLTSMSFLLLRFFARDISRTAEPMPIFIKSSRKVANGLQ